MIYIYDTYDIYKTILHMIYIKLITWFCFLSFYHSVLFSSLQCFLKLHKFSVGLENKPLINKTLFKFWFVLDCVVYGQAAWGLIVSWNSFVSWYTVFYIL